MPTPFTPDGRLDEESLARLTRFLVARGVDGVTVLGFLGEAHKLSEAEQDVVVTVTVQAAGGRVPVFAGASAGGVKVGVERGLRFVELGAAGLMVAPVAPEAATVLAQYRELDEALAASGGRVPVIVHDYPASTGVRGAADPDPARRRDAADAYRRAAAFLAFEFQPVVGLALRKEVYRRRGAIASGLVRAPGAQLDDELARELTDQLEHLAAARPDLTAVPAA